MATAQTDWEKWFEGVWAYREETLYKDMFGDLGPGIHPLPPAVFAELGKTDPDPRWLTHGVFACPATAQRNNWVYVTSALSNPWGDDPATVQPESYSGLGFEFLLQTPAEAPWAVGILHWLMAVQLLIAAGEIKTDFLGYMDRVPVGGPLDGKASLLHGLFVTEPEGWPRQIQLPSGAVDLMLCTGITDRERDFAKSQGGEALQNMLRHHGYWPVTDTKRASAV